MLSSWPRECSVSRSFGVLAQAKGDFRMRDAELWQMGPPITGAFALAGIVVCNRMTMASHTLPDWMVTPPISFTGMSGPQRWVYVCCFGAVALAFAAMAIPYYDYVLHTSSQRMHTAVHLAFTLAFASFIGLFVQAAFPMQLDLLETLANLSDDASAHSMAESLTLQTYVHQLGAICFFLCSVLHGLVIMYVYGSANTGLPFNRKRHFWPKTALLLCAIVPLVLGFVWHPGAGSTTSKREKINFGGIMQWAAVGTLICFWMTYSIDFSTILRATKQSKTS